MVVKIFEMRTSVDGRPTPKAGAGHNADSLPLPVALNFAYPALSFHFTSWMPSSDLRVLRSESRSDIASLLLRQKDHLEHRSPLAVVEDIEPARGKRPNFTRRRTTSSGGVWPWSSGGSGGGHNSKEKALTGSKSFSTLTFGRRRSSLTGVVTDPDEATAARGYYSTEDGADSDGSSPDECDKALEDRVLWWDEADQPATPWSSASKSTQDELGRKVKEDEALVMCGATAADADGEGGDAREGGGKGAVAKGTKASEGEMLAETRLAMTSRTAFFNGLSRFKPFCLHECGLRLTGVSLSLSARTDRIISPSMVSVDPYQPLRSFVNLELLGLTRLDRLFTVPGDGASLRRTAQCSRPALGLPSLANLYTVVLARSVPARVHVLWRAGPSRGRRTCSTRNRHLSGFTRALPANQQGLLNRLSFSRANCGRRKKPARWTSSRGKLGTVTASACRPRAGNANHSSTRTRTTGSGRASLPGGATATSRW